VLQEKEFEPVGSNDVIQSDVRVIAATSTDLEAAIKRGEFRADLYYRLNVLPIQVPPLRERLDDLPALSEAILEELRSQHELDGEALALLGQHAWPGNIRELRNVLERAALLSDDLLTVISARPSGPLPRGAHGTAARRTVEHETSALPGSASIGN
jgi:transcriptional regulator with PAS, ATPase and Fis domain